MLDARGRRGADCGQGIQTGGWWRDAKEPQGCGSSYSFPTIYSKQPQVGISLVTSPPPLSNHLGCRRFGHGRLHGCLLVPSGEAVANGVSMSW
jgi:hypothetical protein